MLRLHAIGPDLDPHVSPAFWGNFIGAIMGHSTENWAACEDQTLDAPKLVL